MNLLKTYRKTFISSVIGVIMFGLFPGIVLLHDVYADNRYVMKSEDLRSQIQAIDNALFEVSQEISFSDSDQDRRKYVARKEYYENLKEALKERLKSKT